MDYARIIHDYVDGSLDPGKEEELFLMLSSSEELRADLKQQFAIKNAVKSDTAAFTPTADSTMNIFGALGFTPPPVPAPSAVVAPAPVPSGFFTTVGSIIRRYSQGLIGGVISAVATSLLFTTAIQSDLFKSGNEQSSQEQAIVKTVPPQETETASSMSEDKSVKEEVIKEKIIYKKIYVPIAAEPVKSYDAKNSQNNTEVNPVSEQSTPAPKFIFVSQTPYNAEQSKTLPRFNASAPSVLIMSSKSEPVELYSKPIGISAELSSGQYFSLPDETISPDKYQKFNNLGIALLFDLSDELKIGGEYRRENFFQRYKGIKNDLPYIFEQQPNFESYGLVVRYQPLVLASDLFAPYAQLTFGGNNAGLLGRAMLGGEIIAGRYYSILLGFEYSSLRFMHNDNYFYSQKAGVQFGVKLKF